MSKRVGGEVGEVGRGLTNGVFVARVRSLDFYSFVLFCFCFLIYISILFYLFTLLQIFFFFMQREAIGGLKQE